MPLSLSCAGWEAASEADTSSQPLLAVPFFFPSSSPTEAAGSLNWTWQTMTGDPEVADHNSTTANDVTEVRYSSDGAMKSASKLAR